MDSTTFRSNKAMSNLLLDAETQLKAAAAPRRLCSGQRRR